MVKNRSLSRYIDIDQPPDGVWKRSKYLTLYLLTNNTSGTPVVSVNLLYITNDGYSIDIPRSPIITALGYLSPFRPAIKLSKFYQCDPKSKERW